MGLHLHEHDVALLMKKYDHDHDGEISYGEFCSAMIAADYTDRSKGGTSKGQFHDGADGHEEMTLDEKVTVSKIQKRKRERCIAYMEAREWKHCSFNFYYSYLLQTCFIVITLFSFIQKHPNNSFFLTLLIF